MSPRGFIACTNPGTFLEQLLSLKRRLCGMAIASTEVCAVARSVGIFCLHPCERKGENHAEGKFSLQN